jgi:hypothetical protein
VGERDRLAQGEWRKSLDRLAIKLFRPMPIRPVLRGAFYQIFVDMISLAVVSRVYPEWGTRYTPGRVMSSID